MVSPARAAFIERTFKNQFMQVDGPNMTSPTVLRRSIRLRMLLPILLLAVAACQTEEAATEPGASQEFAALATPADGMALQVAPSTGLRAAVAAEAARAESYEFDVLRVPAGSWDGYAQATDGAFLQCLVAWGPREARLAFSVGWQGRLFVQFSAPGWSAETLPPDGLATLRVDEAAETTVNVAASGPVLWASLGTGPAFAEILAEGEELTIVSGSNTLVYPLTDSHIAIAALYDCLDRETGEDSGDGAFAIYGLVLDEAARARIVDDVTRLIRARGFDDFVIAPAEQTRERHGDRMLLSGRAWQGRAEIFVNVFGTRSAAKKALAELVDDSARMCRGEVAARLVRMEPVNEVESFGRSSLLCSGAGDEFALETLGIFSNGEVVALHAIVRSVDDRAQVEQTFNAMKETLVTSN